MIAGNQTHENTRTTTTHAHSDGSIFQQKSIAKVYYYLLNEGHDFSYNWFSICGANMRCGKHHPGLGLLKIILTPSRSVVSLSPHYFRFLLQGGYGIFSCWRARCAHHYGPWSLEQQCLKLAAVVQAVEANMAVLPASVAHLEVMEGKLPPGALSALYFE